VIKNKNANDIVNKLIIIVIIALIFSAIVPSKTIKACKYCGSFYAVGTVAKVLETVWISEELLLQKQNRKNTR